MQTSEQINELATALAEAQGWTQKQAAEALGLNLRTIALYEAGERDGGKPVVIPRVVELACRALPPSPDSGEVEAAVWKDAARQLEAECATDRQFAALHREWILNAMEALAGPKS